MVARYTIRSNAGALVYVRNDGLRVASRPEIAARLARGEAVPFDSYRFRTVPRFETSANAEMARAAVRRRRYRAPDGVAIDLHEVLWVLRGRARSEYV